MAHLDQRNSRADKDGTAGGAAPFRGKSMVVTGGTQGVGLATARLLVERGADVVTICGRNEAIGRKATSELGAGGARALFVPAAWAVRNNVMTSQHSPSCGDASRARSETEIVQ